MQSISDIKSISVLQHKRCEMKPYWNCDKEHNIEVEETPNVRLPVSHTSFLPTEVKYYKICRLGEPRSHT